MAQVIVVPGLGGVGDEHWQARWVRERAGAVMVRQRDWERPERDEWVAALDATIRQATGPVVLVAHSLGCHTLAHWAAEHTAPVRAALLVAPPDIEHSAAHGAPIAGFGPPAAGPLPFPAVLAASRTDPWSGLDASRRLAERWGARFVDLGDAGHVNTDSGHGPWPEGDELFDELLRMPAGGPRSA
jgi:predicted alpha/beta hydrolase family esterase